METVEITGDALKTYLDKKLGSDGRIAFWQYEYEARMLLKLGFTNFKQIEECIEPYDHDILSRTLWGTRQGQISRFENMLMASMGEEYIKKHPYNDSEWGSSYNKRILENMIRKEIPIGNYIPK